MLVYLIRHGQSFNTHPQPGVPDPTNPPLTPPGREEAERAARRLHSLGVTRLLTSAMLRTVETALIISREVGRSAEVRLGLHEFRETTGYPCWGGRELAARYPDLVIAPDLVAGEWIYGGEARRAAITRAERLLSWLGKEAAANPEGRYAIVTHGAFCQIVLGRVLRAGFEEMERVVIDNTAVSTLLISALGVVVLGINDTTHLADDRELDPVAGLTR